MHEELPEQLDETRRRLLDVLSKFKKEQLNIIPIEGVWSAAQVAEHILKSLKGILKTLHGPVKETKREPAAKLVAVKHAMLDSNIRYTAPDFLKPSISSPDQEVLVNSIDTKLKQVADAFHQLSLTETCIAYELPGAGTLTRLEWIYFVIYHTERHMRQIENIHSGLLKAQ